MATKLLYIALGAEVSTLIDAYTIKPNEIDIGKLNRSTIENAKKTLLKEIDTYADPDNESDYTARYTRLGISLRDYERGIRDYI